MCSLISKREVNANGAKANVERFALFVLLRALHGEKEITTTSTKEHEGRAETTALKLADGSLPR
jgi:hypothetical protein